MAMVKTAPMNKAQAISWMNNFFQSFAQVYNQQKELTVADFEKIVTRNFQFVNNGQIQARSSAEYLNRANVLRKKFAHFELKAKEEPVAMDNRIAVHYELELRAHNGQKSQVYIMAFATLEDNKIAQWHQVTHEKGATKGWDN